MKIEKGRGMGEKKEKKDNREMIKGKEDKRERQEYTNGEEKVRREQRKGKDIGIHKCGGGRKRETVRR